MRPRGFSFYTYLAIIKQMNKQIKKVFFNNKGFSLVELMVVIAIIGILTAIVTTNFSQSKAKSRDAKRVSDLAQIQLALELAFDRCRVYPSTPLVVINPVCSGRPLSDFISVIPRDSNGSEYFYGVQNFDYVLGAQLETDSGVLDDDVDNPVGETEIYGVNCGTDDDADLLYCVQPR